MKQSAERSNRDNLSEGKISLRLYGNLARFVGEKTGWFEFCISPCETFESLMKKLQIPASETTFVIRNGLFIYEWNQRVVPGDNVEMLGLVDGG